MRSLVLAVVTIAAWSVAGPCSAQEIFIDGFESGPLLAWSDLRSPCSVPGEAGPEEVSNPTTVIGNGTPASCTSAAVVDAIAQGGIITFDCGPDPVTITMLETAKVYNNTGGSWYPTYPQISNHSDTPIAVSTSIIR